METRKIGLTDSFGAAIVKLAQGNVGAATALMRIADSAVVIDPQAALGPWAPLFALEEMGLYGERIWLLWKDVCGEDPVRVMTLLRAKQLGIIGEGVVRESCSDRPTSVTFDFPGLLAQVQAQLSQFAKAPT